MNNERCVEVGDIIRIKSDNDNENYDEFRGQDLIVTGVYDDVEGHQGYDETIYPEKLVDLETEEGYDVPYSLYEYEFDIVG